MNHIEDREGYYIRFLNELDRANETVFTDYLSLMEPNRVKCSGIGCTTCQMLLNSVKQGQTEPNKDK